MPYDAIGEVLSLNPMEEEKVRDLVQHYGTHKFKKELKEVQRSQARTVIV